MRRGWLRGGMLTRRSSRAQRTQCALCRRSTNLLTTWVIDFFLVALIASCAIIGFLLSFSRACEANGPQHSMSYYWELGQPPGDIDAGFTCLERRCALLGFMVLHCWCRKSHLRMVVHACLLSRHYELM